LNWLETLFQENDPDGSARDKECVIGRVTVNPMAAAADVSRMKKRPRYSGRLAAMMTSASKLATIAPEPRALPGWWAELLRVPAEVINCGRGIEIISFAMRFPIAIFAFGMNGLATENAARHSAGGLG